MSAMTKQDIPAKTLTVSVDKLVSQARSIAAVRRKRSAGKRQQQQDDTATILGIAQARGCEPLARLFIANRMGFGG
jgi:hypothetical protein